MNVYKQSLSKALCKLSPQLHKGGFIMSLAAMYHDAMDLRLWLKQ